MIGARLAPRKLLWLGVVTFVVTLLASRGTHSETHEFIATVALGLEVALVICSGLGWRRPALFLFVAVIVCWLAVFVTDSFYINAYRNLRYLVVNGAWQ